VRLKRTLNRSVGDKQYHRWLIADVPRAVVDALGWEEGVQLEATVRDGALTIRRA
jgi:hypothetical protein